MDGKGCVSHTGNLLRRSSAEVIDLSLVRGATTMPKEHPLQRLVPLELVLKAKLIFLVGKLEQIQQLRRRFETRKRRGLRVVHQHGDTTVRVEAQEPLFLLLVGRDVDDRGGPLGAVGIPEFLKHDLCGLAIGSVLCYEVQAFGLRDLFGRFGNVELIRHCVGCEFQGSTTLM